MLICSCMLCTLTETEKVYNLKLSTRTKVNKTVTGTLPNKFASLTLLKKHGSILTCTESPAEPLITITPEAEAQLHTSSSMLANNIWTFLEVCKLNSVSSVLTHVCGFSYPGDSYSTSI